MTKDRGSQVPWLDAETKNVSARTYPRDARFLAPYYDCVGDELLSLLFPDDQIVKRPRCNSVGIYLQSRPGGDVLEGFLSN